MKIYSQRKFRSKWKFSLIENLVQLKISTDWNLTPNENLGANENLFQMKI